ncbi:MAG TPA: hypothetical protein VLZ83_15495 [Edaphocola sp.]|nr:hypothetical protein [Edaphocola sp.]
MKKTIGCSIITLLLLSMVNSSCGKKDNSKNEGINEFIPTNTTNWWRYEASDGTNFKRYYTGRDTIIDNFDFNLYEQISDGGVIVKEFYGKFEGNYYSLIKVNDEGTVFMKAQILPGTPKLGDTWESLGNITYNGINFYAKTVGEVLSTDDVINMNGTNLDNIVVAKNRLYAKISPTDPWEDCGTVIQKFKKGLGFVAEEYDFHVGTFVDKVYSYNITDYHIEK